MKDLTVILKDRPGTLADMGEALGEAGINIKGLCGFPCEGKGVIHILPEVNATQPTIVLPPNTGAARRQAGTSPRHNQSFSAVATAKIVAMPMIVIYEVEAGTNCLYANFMRNASRNALKTVIVVYYARDFKKQSGDLRQRLELR